MSAAKRTNRGSKVVISLQLEAVLHEMLVTYSATRDRSKSWVLREALKEYLRNEGVKVPEKIVHDSVTELTDEQHEEAMHDPLNHGSTSN